ncbi:MAG: helix-turn-helix domain-containing protein [Aristaeellaceae bacterium]
MSYHQFTSDERICLWELLEEGYGIRAISRALGRAPSSVSREIKRNSSKHCICFEGCFCS